MKGANVWGVCKTTTNSYFQFYLVLVWKCEKFIAFVPYLLLSSPFFSIRSHFLFRVCSFNIGWLFSRTALLILRTNKKNCFIDLIWLFSMDEYGFFFLIVLFLFLEYTFLDKLESGNKSRHSVFYSFLFSCLAILSKKHKKNTVLFVCVSFCLFCVSRKGMESSKISLRWFAHFKHIEMFCLRYLFGWYR